MRVHQSKPFPRQLFGTPSKFAGVSLQKSLDQSTHVELLDPTAKQAWSRSNNEASVGSVDPHWFDIAVGDWVRSANGCGVSVGSADPHWFDHFCLAGKQGSGRPFQSGPQTLIGSTNMDAKAYNAYAIVSVGSADPHWFDVGSELSGLDACFVSVGSADPHWFDVC